MRIRDLGDISADHGRSVLAENRVSAICILSGCARLRWRVLDVSSWRRCLLWVQGCGATREEGPLGGRNHRNPRPTSSEYAGLSLVFITNRSPSIETEKGLPAGHFCCSSALTRGRCRPRPGHLEKQLRMCGVYARNTEDLAVRASAADIAKGEHGNDRGPQGQ